MWGSGFQAVLFRHSPKLTLFTAFVCICAHVCLLNLLYALVAFWLLFTKSGERWVNAWKFLSGYAVWASLLVYLAQFRGAERLLGPAAV